MVSRDPKMNFDIALPFSNDFKKRKVVSDAMLKVKEAGILAKVGQIWMPKDEVKSREVEKESEGFSPATISQVWSAFCLWMVGILVAAMVMVLECLMAISGCQRK